MKPDPSSDSQRSWWLPEGSGRWPSTKEKTGARPKDFRKSSETLLKMKTGRPDERSRSFQKIAQVNRNGAEVAKDSGISPNACARPQRWSTTAA